VFVDLTRGELGTRGTIDVRKEEAREAARILGAVARENLALPDGQLALTAEAKRKVVEVIRRFRPRLVLLPYFSDRHPDHVHASEIVYEGTFLSHRPEKILYYMGWEEFSPSFIVDISEQFERKMEAIRAYASQFSLVNPSYPETRLTSPAMDHLIRSRMAHYGALIEKEYGEAFLVRGVLEVDDPLNLRFSSF